MRNTLLQRGQGMTEYIIIVALIAVAAIGATRFFGGVVRSQTAAIAQEVAGQDGTASNTEATTRAGQAVTDAAIDKTLSNYTGNSN